jgi:molybdate transport system ATP-binding protein
MTLSVTIEHQQGEFRIDAAFECGSGVTALFGPSGAGKTTLVNAIAGLARPRKGRVAFDGDVLFDTQKGICVAAGQRRFGYVFQEGRLFPHLTVRRNLLYSRRFNHHPEVVGEFAHITELLGITGLLERRPAQLSGGEKQRVAIGRALLARPRLLLLDEPLASIDAQRKEEVLRYLELLRDELRIPMVYVSHSVEEVVRLADTVVLLAAGKTVATGDVEEIMGRPDLLPGSGMFEGGAIVDATVVRLDAEYGLATLVFSGGELTVANSDLVIGANVRVRIRARDVSIALDPPQRISIQNVLSGEITALGKRQGAVVDVSIVVGVVTLRARVTQRAVEQLALVPGARVYALIKAVSLDRRGTAQRQLGI